MLNFFIHIKSTAVLSSSMFLCYTRVILMNYICSCGYIAVDFILGQSDVNLNSNSLLVVIGTVLTQLL